jgi:hypothetical protein
MEPLQPMVDCSRDPSGTLASKPELRRRCRTAGRSAGTGACPSAFQHRAHEKQRRHVEQDVLEAIHIVEKLIGHQLPEAAGEDVLRGELQGRELPAKECFGQQRENEDRGVADEQPLYTPGDQPQDDEPDEKERNGEPMDIFRIAALAYWQRCTPGPACPIPVMACRSG